VALLVPLIAAVVVAYAYRDQPFGLDLTIRIGCVIALVILGWAFAMSLGRALGPALLKRLDPGAAGTGRSIPPTAHESPIRWWPPSTACISPSPPGSE
jgi:hypothetical protein